MAATTASTAYRKRDGMLAVSANKQSVTWTPVAPPGAAPELILNVADVTNLQQTPAANPKVALKVVVQPPGAPAAENYVFNFTSPSSARAEQESVTEALRNAIQAAKARSGQTASLTVASDGGGQSAAMAIAQAVSSGGRASDGWYDDARLKSSVELQQSLLRADTDLRRRFEEALKEKPESITVSQFSGQFWSQRLHLLRAHAVEKGQSQGAYNVLSEIKPKNIEGQTKLSLSKDQIQLIFSQHPLVRRVYDENVPPLKEAEFWARFFVSRLFRKLKGDRITEADSLDERLDKYLNYDDSLERGKQLLGAHVPHYIDLEGNEQNHSQRQGNLPDLTMRPSVSEKVPILRVLNDMSEKMMSHVAPVDGDPHAPIGMDEETFNELQLRDLEADAADNRVVLHVKNPGRFVADSKDNRHSTEDQVYAQQNPEDVISTLKADLQPDSLAQRPGGAGLDLSRAITEEGEASASSSEDERSPSKSASKRRRPRIGSHAALAAATSQIFRSIKQQQQRSTNTLSNPSGAAGQPPSTLTASSIPLSQTTFDTLLLTHSTTTEFLHYFYAVFHSGDASRAAELATLVETLSKSLDRIAAVAATAEQEKQDAVRKMKAAERERFQRTGKKRKVEVDWAEVGGRGAAGVESVMGPTVRAVGKAVEGYRRAWEEENRGYSFES